MTLDRIRKLPCWQGDLSVEVLRGGLSNQSWKVTDGAGPHVVRFGKDYPFHHVFRDREIMTARAAAAAGFGPAVEYSEPGVMVTQFLGARTWTAADVAANPARIGALLADFHAQMPAHVSGPGFAFWPFHVIRDYALTLAATHWAPRMAGFVVLADRLEKAQVPLPVVFGHHDLLPANILEDDTRLWLIDFEYAGFGTAMFDLAGAASNSAMAPDAATEMLTAYFGASPGEDLQRAFAAMQCASLLREAMWAMVSEQYLDTPGVNFAVYAAENLDAFDAALAAYERDHGDP